MKCPYCYKRTYDMVTHLNKNSACSKEHVKSLTDQLKIVIATNSKLRKLEEIGRSL